MKNPLPPVFLSASVPDRKTWLYKPDPIAIVEAIRALVAVAARDRELVFGGHPAISPMVEAAAETLPMGSPSLAGDAPQAAEPARHAGGVTAADNVFIYQSEYFRQMIPDASKRFKNLVWTGRDPNSPGDREACLLKMRREMIGSRPFAAGFFVGGMDGVEKEWALFGDIHPNVPRFPVASTLGAARLLWIDHKLPEILKFVASGPNAPTFPVVKTPGAAWSLWIDRILPEVLTPGAGLAGSRLSDDVRLAADLEYPPLLHDLLVGRASPPLP